MSVNYLIEINALDDWELTHPLSATAYKVLRKLLYLANKERFPERITVPNGVLMSLTGCSEDSLIKARNQLIQYGLISYKGQKKVTPVYMIAYFSHNPTYNSKLQGYEQGIKQGYEQGIKQGYEQGNQHGTYINKILGGEGEEDTPALPEEPKPENAVLYFRRCGIALEGRQYEAIRDFYENGITDDMLCFAADEAVEYGAVNFAYVRRVVENWICNGVQTLAEAKERQQRFRQEQEAGKAARKTPSAIQTPTAGPAPRFFSDRWGD